LKLQQELDDHVTEDTNVVTEDDRVLCYLVSCVWDHDRNGSDWEKAIPRPRN